MGAAEAGPDMACSRAGVCYPVVLLVFLAFKTATRGISSQI